MSKKIAKRSLVLGALMAMVITGSAMAAELELTTQEAYDSFNFANEGWQYNSGEWISNATSSKDNTIILGSSEDDQLIVDRRYISGGNAGSFFGGTYGTEANGNTVTLDNVKLDNSYVTIIGGQAIETTGSDFSASNNTVNISNSDITENGTETMVIAGSMTTSAFSAVENITASNNTVNIENSNLSAENEGTVVAIVGTSVVADGAIADANQVNIKGGTVAADVYGALVGSSDTTVTNTTVSITGDKDNALTFTGNVYAVEGTIAESSNNNINVSLSGEGSTFTGTVNGNDAATTTNVAVKDGAQFTTDGDSNITNLTLENKGQFNLANESTVAVDKLDGNNGVISLQDLKSKMTVDTNEATNLTVAIDKEKLSGVSEKEALAQMKDSVVDKENNFILDTTQVSGVTLTGNLQQDVATGEYTQAVENNFAVEGKLSAADGNFKVDGEGNVTGGTYNGVDVSATAAQVADNSAAISGLNQRLGSLNGKINKVGAGAAALAALHPLDYDPDDKLTFSAGMGNYAGENAAAIGAFYRPDEKFMVSLGGTMGNGENMVNLGVSIGLDKPNGLAKMSKRELIQKVSTMEAENEALEERIAKLEALVAKLAEK